MECFRARSGDGMVVPELLGTHETTKRLKFLLKKKGLARLAVAYWGEGAMRQLGLERLPSETRVLCDLWSGCCNPDEIKGLLKAGVSVRYFNKLHAKLYCTPGGIIIGSSNASSNGLGSEGQELSGNVELSAEVNSPVFRTVAETWFDKRWAKAVDQEVDEDLAERARPAWKRRQAHGPRSPPTTLLAELAANPDAFRIRPIRILVYHWEEGGGPGYAAVERAAKSEYSKAQWHRMETRGLEDWYWDSTSWPVEPGTTFLDFDLARPPWPSKIWWDVEGQRTRSNLDHRRE